MHLSTETDLEILIEILIDRHGLREVLTSIAEICAAKGEHIEENWQDRPLARKWRKAGTAIGKALSRFDTP